MVHLWDVRGRWHLKRAQYFKRKKISGRTLNLRKMFSDVSIEWIFGFVSIRFLNSSDFEKSLYTFIRCNGNRYLHRIERDNQLNRVDSRSF